MMIAVNFLDADRIRSILNKFWPLLPVAVKFEDKQINNTHPAWTKSQAN